MKKCTQCLYVYPENADFCPECGAMDYTIFAKEPLGETKVSDVSGPEAAPQQPPQATPTANAAANTAAAAKAVTHAAPMNKNKQKWTPISSNGSIYASLFLPMGGMMLIGLEVSYLIGFALIAWGTVIGWKLYDTWLKWLITLLNALWIIMAVVLAYFILFE